MVSSTKGDEVVITIKVVLILRISYEKQGGLAVQPTGLARFRGGRGRPTAHEYDFLL
jgi:hypothetical protein